MRDYAIVSPRFWTGDTGRQIRKLGAPAQVLATYLMTGPLSNMLGLYYLPLPTVAHETGLPLASVQKALKGLADVGFAFYDDEGEQVWVPEMACWQIDEALEPSDNRIKKVAKDLREYSRSKFYASFLERYGIAFSLPLEALPKPLRSPFEAPSKPLPRGGDGGQEPLRSQEQEQEQEQEPEQERPAYVPSASGSPVPLALVPGSPERRGAGRDQELRWRIDVVWRDHLTAWRKFFKRENGVAPSQTPTLHQQDILKPIREGLLTHDNHLLGEHLRDQWCRESKVRAAGIGIFYDPWCTGHHKDNDASSGGKRYLEHWRPWKRQHGKPDPVPRFAELYFEKRDAIEAMEEAHG